MGAVAAVASGLSGCGLLHRGNAAAAPPVEQLKAPVEKLKVIQSDTMRDLVTGDRQFVFCSGTACETFTAKTVIQPAMRVATAAPQSEQRAAAAAERGQVLVQIPFEYDRSMLSPAGKAALTASMESIKKASSIRVVGLADSVDRDAYNLELAKRRAATVAGYLRATFGTGGKSPKIEVDARVVKVSADGEYPPGEAFKGRRVDLSVLILEVK
jgi:outer membrane protein OmpA-like peptidoglycan-associated protein